MNVDRQRPKSPMATPGATNETPTIDAPASPQRGDISEDGSGTGAFSYVGHAIVHVGGAAHSSFVPAPPVADHPQQESGTRRP